MAAVDPVSLGGLETLAAYPSRAILTDNPREADALAFLTPANPRVCFPGATAETDLSPLAGREVVVWVSRPTREYWAAASAQAWLRRLLATATPVSVVAADDAVGPSRWTGEGLGSWLTARLVPAATLLPDNVVPIKKPRKPRATPSPDGPLMLTEHSLALAFTARHPNLRYVEPWKHWLEWNGTRWEPDCSLRVLDYARQLCVDVAAESVVFGAPLNAIAKAHKASTRSAVEQLAKTDRAHAASVGIWDLDNYSLCTPGGMVDLRTGMLRAGEPEDYVTKQTNATPQGECPHWLRFLDQAMAGDKEMQDYLQRVVGYMLTGDTSEEVFFFAYGGGGNGKGTFINTLTDILGDYAMVSSMDVFTEAKESRHSTEVARLRGGRFVSAQEVEEGKRWAENRLKEMTGGDRLTARFMRQDEFSFKPQFKLLLAGNNKPAIRTLDDAIRRRLHLIPFVVSFKGADRDNGLKERLLTERDGILAWAVQGCLEWQRSGLRPPAAVLAATQAYFEQQDTLKLWADDRLEVSPGARELVSKLYASYTEWCKTGGETYTMPQRKWALKMEERGHETKRLAAGVFILGAKIADSMTMKRGYQTEPLDKDW